MCVWCTWVEDQYPDALDPNFLDKKVDTFHEDIPPLFAVMEKKNCIFGISVLYHRLSTINPPMVVATVFILLDQDERCEKC